MADEPRPAPGAALVSFDDLQGRLGDPKLRLLDARSQADYDKGHIPGAVHVDPKRVEEMAKQKGALTDRALWAEWIEPLGIAAEQDVLVYDGGRQLDAARLWWLLRYVGVDRAGLIDGNFALWQGQGRPTASEATRVEPIPFAIAFRDDRSATRQEVLDAIRSKSAQVLDARSIEEHSGEKAMSKRGGHIPPACHLDWNNMVDAEGRFRPADEVREKLLKSGIVPGRTVISHCQGGGRASVNAFMLERLGFPAQNYYPGWSDWGNAEDTPVETGVRKPMP